MPETLRGLWRQRLRWSVGGTQAVLDSTRALFSGKRTNDPRPVPALLLSEHAAAFGVPPEAIERWRQSQVVVVQFDAANRLEDAIAKAPAAPDADPADRGEG